MRGFDDHISTAAYRGSPSGTRTLRGDPEDVEHDSIGDHGEIVFLEFQIVIDLSNFLSYYNAKNLEEYGAEIDMIEETIHQCRVAIRNEKSRRFLQDDIQRMTDKNTEKTMQKHAFKLKRRRSLLRKATPYQMQSKDSIGH
ncbi:hypothetical protein OS493_026727 [Desmophyllum pertusum]|uniref:Uncharacterized protein n=1 Tax=Desmophyllum pertusum TaxID=174260 RepID=A0A9W9ZYG9_9CNID|nr:hypothetical protein OS493_026727 [Desmophyllum pertusum]